MWGAIRSKLSGSKQFFGIELSRNSEKRVLDMFVVAKHISDSQAFAQHEKRKFATWKRAFHKKTIVWNMWNLLLVETAIRDRGLIILEVCQSQRIETGNTVVYSISNIHGNCLASIWHGNICDQISDRHLDTDLHPLFTSLCFLEKMITVLISHSMQVLTLVIAGHKRTEWWSRKQIGKSKQIIPARKPENIRQDPIAILVPGHNRNVEFSSYCFFSS